MTPTERTARAEFLRKEIERHRAAGFGFGDAVVRKLNLELREIEEQGRVEAQQAELDNMTPAQIVDTIEARW